MSTFGGRMKEYQYISIDRFDNSNLSSRAYFLSHCHSDHMVGLSLDVFYEHLRDNKNIKLYCSPITESFLLNTYQYNRLKPFIKSIPIEESVIISVPDEKFEKEEELTVTLLPAGHCPGSVMFLFEGPEGIVLYTGDFRFSYGDAARMKLLHNGDSVKSIRSLYVDTTFCIPEALYIPSRDRSLDAAIKLSREWLNRSPGHVIHLQCSAQYGYEYIFIGLKKALNLKVHIDSPRIKRYTGIPEILDAITGDFQESRVHACFSKSNFNLPITEEFEAENVNQINLNQKVDSKDEQEVFDDVLPCRYEVRRPLKLKVLHIKLSAMWFTKYISVNDIVFGNPDEGSCRICFSTHSSMTEIYDFVTYLHPENVYPNVVPMGSEESEIINRIRNFCPPPLIEEEDEILTLGELKKRPKETESSLEDGSLEFDIEFSTSCKKLKHDDMVLSETVNKPAVGNTEMKDVVSEENKDGSLGFPWLTSPVVCTDGVNKEESLSGKVIENDPKWIFNCSDSDDDYEASIKKSDSLPKNSNSPTDESCHKSEVAYTSQKIIKRDLMFPPNYENSLSRPEAIISDEIESSSSLQSTPIKGTNSSSISQDLFLSDSESSLNLLDNTAREKTNLENSASSIVTNNIVTDEKDDSSNDSVICLSFNNRIFENCSSKEENNNVKSKTKNQKCALSDDKLCLDSSKEKQLINECTPVKQFKKCEAPDKIPLSKHIIKNGEKSTESNDKSVNKPSHQMNRGSVLRNFKTDGLNDQKFERNDISLHVTNDDCRESDVEIIDSDATPDSLSPQSPICVFDSRELFDNV